MDRPLLLMRANHHICRACRATYRNRTSLPVFTTVIPREHTRQIASYYPDGRPTKATGSSIIHREIRHKIPTKPVDGSQTTAGLLSAPTSAGQAPTRAEVDQARELCDAILKHPSVPSEKQTLVPLRMIKRLAAKAAGVNQEPTTTTATTTDETASPASDLLSLDSTTFKRAPKEPRTGASAATIDLLSVLAYNVLKHPPVFITPKILETYVTLQYLLVRPSTLPEIFTLYGSKPVPKTQPAPTKTPSPSTKSTTTVTYQAQSPTAIASAIPTPTASLALTTAIRAHTLPLALSIITTTFSTTAFRSSKIFRRALPAILAVPLAPIAIYTFASSLSAYQTTLPPENFTAIAFAGILTYTTAVSTIGYVALTTANDQMQRVTWATGMPLWERWVREEERAAVDRVVQAWGFREKWRWGEEEGEEWEGLKEWAGSRGMWVDRIGLMEGME